MLQLVDTAVSKHSRERACFEKPWNRPYGASVVVVLEFDVSHGHRRAEYVAIANAAAREYGLPTPSYTLLISSWYMFNLLCNQSRNVCWADATDEGSYTNAYVSGAETA